MSASGPQAIAGTGSLGQEEVRLEPVRIDPLLRVGIAALAILAFPNAVFLYFFPSRAATDYAWPIHPPINAAVLGAGYFAGCVAAAVAFRARYWRSILGLAPALIVLSLAAISATIIYRDRFDWHYSLTILWTVIYAIAPPINLYFLFRHGWIPADAPTRDPRLNGIRAASFAIGGVLAVLALILFFAPGTAVDNWPWKITPLLSRVFGGWYGLAAGALLLPAFAARRAHELPVPYATVATWSALLLLLPIIYSESVHSSAELWLWVALQVATLALCAWALVRSVGVMRAEGQRL